MSEIFNTKTYDDDSSRSDKEVSEQADSNSEAEDSDADAPLPMPESLSRIFAEEGLLRDYTKSEKEKELSKHSLFTKISKKVDSKTTSGNL